jgi:hypothetical protein
MGFGERALSALLAVGARLVDDPPPAEEDAGDAPTRLPGGVWGVGAAVAVVFMALHVKALKINGEAAPYAVLTAAAWGLLGMTQVIFQVDMNDEIYFEAGNDPADAFEALDSDGLMNLWPRYYWGYYIYATVFTFATYLVRTGYMGVGGRIRGALSSTLLPRLPFLILGLLVAALVRGRAAKLAEDSDDEGYPQGFKQLYKAWLQLALHCSGIALASVLVGVGAGSLPRRLWVGTELQRIEKLKRERIKNQNQLTFAHKSLSGLKKAAEAERDAIPLSDPAYALYHSVLRNAEDPFLEKVAPGEIPPEDDTGEPPAVRKRRLLSTVRGVDHQAIAKMRRSVLETLQEIRLVDDEIEANDAAIEAAEASGRAGMSGRGFAGVAGSVVTGFLAAVMFMWLLLSPLADGRELKPYLGLLGLFADPQNDNGGGKPFWYLGISLYMQICVLAAVLIWRRWFFVYTIGLRGDSHQGSIMRVTEVMLYCQIPVMTMFSHAVVNWSWMLDDPAETNLHKVMHRLDVFPLFGTMWNSIGCLVAGICIVATAFFNLPGVIQSLRFRQSAYAQANDPTIAGGAGAASTTRRSNFAIFGSPIEGELLSAAGDFLGTTVTGAVDPHDDEQMQYMHPVGANFQWARKAPDSPTPTPIQGANGAVYLPTAEDIGFIIACSAEFNGAAATAMASDKTRMAIPQIRDLRIEGGPYHSAPFKAVGTYVGGVEGDSVFRWFKVKSGVTTPLFQATGPVFQPSIDEVAVTLRVEYTPIRSDGVAGEMRTGESMPVKVDPIIGKRVRNNIVSGFAELPVTIEGREGVVTVNDKHVRILKGSKTLLRDYLGTHVSCTLSQSDPYQYTIVCNGKEYACNTEDHLERDVHTLTIRSFAIMVSRSAGREAKKNEGMR